jgi:hypothetical protein
MPTAQNNEPKISMKTISVKKKLAVGLGSLIATIMPPCF